MLLADNMIIFLEFPRVYKQTHKLVCEYKVNTQKSIGFLYASHKVLENKIKIKFK